MLFVICYLVGYLLYASIYAIIGAVIGAEREAGLYQQLLSLVLVFPIAITLSLVARPGDPLAERLTWIPLVTPTLVLLRSAVSQISTAEIVGSLSLSVVTGFLLLLLAARLFRGFTLLSGRRLGWAEAWRGAASQEPSRRSSASSPLT